MILTESRNYIISNEYEIAYLIDKSSGKIIAAVADMYGDPSDARISDDERYCVIIGCGAVIYRIREPFEDYCCDRMSAQWNYIQTDPDTWFDSIETMDNDKIILRSEDDSLYEISVHTGSILKIYGDSRADMHGI